MSITVTDRNCVFIEHHGKNIQIITQGERLMVIVPNESIIENESNKRQRVIKVIGKVIPSVEL